MSSSTSEKIQSLRKRILAESSLHPALYHVADLERLKKDDWPIERFLLHKQMDQEKAYRALVETMQWRMTKVRINDQRWIEFPEEFYRSALFYIGGRDRSGGSVIFVRAAAFGKIRSWSELTNIFFAFLVEQIDHNPELRHSGLSVVINARGVHIDNVDVDSLKFVLALFRDHYPGLLTVLLVYKLPKLLDSIYRMIKSWLNENETSKLVLVNSKTITDYIDLDQLPVEMGGTGSMNRHVPEGVKSTAEIARQLKLKEGKAEKLTKHYQKHYDNGQSEGQSQGNSNEDEDNDDNNVQSK